MNVMLTGRMPSEELAFGSLRSIILRCTMQDPEKRYPSVQTLLYALRTVHDRGVATGSAYGWKRFLPPGFRSGELTHKMLAAAGYALLIFLGQSFNVVGRTVGGDVMCYRVVVTAMLLLMVLFTGNYLDIHDRLPVTRSRNLLLRVIGILLGDVLCFGAAVIILGILLSVVGP